MVLVEEGLGKALVLEEGDGDTDGLAELDLLEEADANGDADEDADAQAEFDASSDTAEGDIKPLGEAVDKLECDALLDAVTAALTDERKDAEATLE